MDDDHGNLDDLTRAELAERDGPGHAVATVLDEWSRRMHGVACGRHGAGMFLELLAAAGWRVEGVDTPSFARLRPFPGAAARVCVRYMPAVSAQEIERAKAAVLESAREVLSEVSQDPCGHPAYYWQWGTPYVAWFCDPGDATRFLERGQENGYDSMFSSLSAVGAQPQTGVKYTDVGHLHCFADGCPRRASLPGNS